jgi:hypothetical protein
MTEHRYRNPWAKSYEPQDYVRTIDPIEYHGCLVFHVLPGQFDVVKAGVCIAQRGGLAGAKLVADSVEDIPAPTYEDAREAMLELYGHY